MSLPAIKLPQPAASSWQARLELGYEQRSMRTVLSHRKHVGPLIVQKPFYPEGGVCHTYLIHPPGGVVGGDQIELDINTAPGVHTLLTTPAANKFYRSAGEMATLRQTINVEANAILEWLPQESILFDASQVNMSTLINLDKQSCFVGWEMICLGRPASGDHYDNGFCFQRLEVYIDGQPKLLERVHFNGKQDFRKQYWGMANYNVSASMLVYPANRELLENLRNYIEHNSNPDLSMAVTLLDEVLVCRGMAGDAEILRESLFSLWQEVRPVITGKPACRPRIWNT